MAASEKCFEVAVVVAAVVVALVVAVVIVFIYSPEIKGGYTISCIKVYKQK